MTEPHFQLINDVAAHVDGRRVEMGTARERCLLVALLLHKGQRVPRTWLLDWIWDVPPALASAELDGFMTNLRRRLLGIGLTDVLSTRDGLCLLDVAADSVDVHRFRELVAKARNMEPTRAAPLLAEALDLTRGEPLAGLTTRRIDGVRQELLEERHAAELAWLRAELEIGHHEALVPRLSRLFDDRTHDAAVAELAMRAYDGAGRQTDALGIYRRHRDKLDESGLLLSPSVRATYQRILNQEDDGPGPATESVVSVSDTELARAREASEPPAEAWKALADRHIVVLVGAPEVCRSAALRLLEDRSHPGCGTVLDVLKTWSEPTVAGLPTPRDGGGYLLTLNNSATDRASVGFAEDLLVYGDRLAGLRSWLVVSTRSDLWRECWRVAGLVTVRLHGQPDADAAHLRLTAPDGVVSVFPLCEGNAPRARVHLGRAAAGNPEPDIVLDTGPDSPVSRCHAYLTRDDGAWWLEPKSKNSTSVRHRGYEDAEQVSDRVLLRDGDVVIIAARAAENGAARDWRIEFRDPQTTKSQQGELP